MSWEILKFELRYHLKQPLFYILFVIFFDFFSNYRIGFVVILVFIFVIGDHDEMNWMRLGDFEFRVTFGARHDFAFFHFVFIEIEFSVAFRTSGHGCSLLPGSRTDRGYYIPRVVGFRAMGFFVVIQKWKK